MAELFAGRYALGRLLGTGGAGRVYAARDERLHRDVAIKLVPTASAEPVARQRFVREARSAAAFTHPNAVALYDAGEAEGSLYLVMELVDGESLAERLADQGPLGPADSERIMAGVLSALAAAHVAGIVHRDVKPGNVLLGRDGAVKLADFGIAKRLDDAAGDVTVIGDIVGTPKYLAPELVGGAPATPSSDVYAAGVVLFEMLAGRPPFDANTPLATALAHRDHPVPDVGALRPVPERLAAVVRTAMAKDPSRRFATADAMRAALTGAAPKTEVVAMPSARAASTSPRTEVMPAPGYRRSSRSPWWIAVVAAMVGGGAVLAYLVVDGDDPDSTASSTSQAVAAATAAPSTAVTTLAPTTGATTTPPDTSTIEGIIAVLSANPDAYGRQTGEVIKDLEKIRGNGRKAEERARETLQHAIEWVESGELDPSVLAMLEPVLTPLMGDEDDDEEDGD
jgi:serine/threonine-protein kinase